MAENLTRTGTVGLELTREEVNDILGNVKSLLRKAQCREVNQVVIDQLSRIEGELDAVDDTITEILDNEEFDY